MISHVLVVVSFALVRICTAPDALVPVLDCALAPDVPQGSVLAVLTKALEAGATFGPAKKRRGPGRPLGTTAERNALAALKDGNGGGAALLGELGRVVGENAVLRSKFPWAAPLLQLSLPEGGLDYVTSKIVDLFACPGAPPKSSADAMQNAKVVNALMRTAAPLGTNRLLAHGLGMSAYCTSRNLRNVGWLHLRASIVFILCWFAGLKKLIDDKKMVPMCLFKSMVSDETPSNIRVQQRTATSVNDVMRLLAQRARGEAADTEQQSVGATRNAKGCAKVLQSYLVCAVLMFDTAAGLYVLFELEVPTWLQVIERTTTECMLSAWCALWTFSCVNLFLYLFPYIVELNALDRAASNKKFHKHQVATLSEISNIFTAWCRTHCKHSVSGAMHALAKPLVSGVIALGMTEKPSGFVTYLQSTLAAFFEARVRWRNGVAPATDGPIYEQRRASLDLMFGNAAKRAKCQRSALRWSLTGSFMNGNYMKRLVDHFCTDRHCRDREECMWSFKNIVTPTLIHAALELFERHKWVDSDLTFEECLVQVLPNGSGIEVVPHAIACYKKGREAKPEDFELSDDDASSVASDSDAWSDIDDGFAPPVAAEDDDAGSAPTNAPPAKDDSWAQFNGRMQNTTCNIFRSYRSVWRLAILLITTAAAAHLMHADLESNSHDCDQRRRANIATGKWSQMGESALDFILSGAETAQFDTEIFELMHHFKFAVVPPGQRTVMLNTFAFRTLSRGGGAANFYLEDDARKAPYTLLAVRTREQASDWLRNTPLCLRCNFAIRHFQWFPGRALGCDHSLQILAAIRVLAFVSVALVEARHAATHRWNMTQTTWLRSLTFLSCWFLLRCWRQSHFRRTDASLIALEDAPPANEPRRGSVQAKFKAKVLRAKEAGAKFNWRVQKRINKNCWQRASGGPWRVFCHERIKGMKGFKANNRPILKRVIKQLSDDYRTIKAENGEEWRRLKRLGAVWASAARETNYRAHSRVLARAKRACVNADRSLKAILSASGRAVPFELKAAVEHCGAVVAADRSRQKTTAETLIKFEHEAVSPESGGPGVPCAELQPMGDPSNMVAVPSNFANLRYFKVAAPTAKLVDYALNHLDKETMAKGAAHFETLHCTITQEDQTPIRHYPSENTLCYRAGFCLHSKKGAFVATLECELLKAVQQWCPPKSKMRNALVHSWLLVRLQKEGGNNAVVWFHIAFASLAHPWTLQLLRMQEERSSRAALLLPHVALEVVPAETVWHNTWVALFHTIDDYRFGHSCELWCLQTPRRLLPEIRPSKYLEAGRVRAKQVLTSGKADGAKPSPVQSDSSPGVIIALGTVASRRDHFSAAEAADEHEKGDHGDGPEDGPDGDGPQDDDHLEILVEAERHGCHGGWKGLSALKACGALGPDPSLVPDETVAELAAIQALLAPAPAVPAPPIGPIPPPAVADPPPPGPLPPPPPPVAVPHHAPLPKNERLIPWPGVKRWRLSEFCPTIDGEVKHVGYVLRCRSHQNDWDIADINGRLPECKISLTFDTKRDSWRMTPLECRKKLKMWAICGAAISGRSDPRTNHTKATCYDPRRLVADMSEDSLDAAAVDITKDYVD